MSDSITGTLAETAFRRARGKAFLRMAWAILNRRPNRLLAYSEVRDKLRVGGPVYRGMEAVPISQIIGSVNRFREFDRAFLPAQNITEDRWKSIGRAYFEDIHLPPVKLYQVGDVYFVVDGNHRVSVARELGREFIDAEVQECYVNVPLTVDIDVRDLEVIGKKAEFLEQTALDTARPTSNLTTTIPDGYDLLLEHIEGHRYLQSKEWEREFSTQEAAAQWYDTVYLPIVRVIRETGALAEFPGRTEADLYLWLMGHLYFLKQRFGDRLNLQAVAENYAERFTPNFLKRIGHWITHQVLRRPRSTEIESF